MQNAAPCTLCKEGGHRAAMCPGLYDPLKEGFYTGGGGGGGHSHDDDERAQQKLDACAVAVRWLQDSNKTLNTNYQNERLCNLLCRGDGGDGAVAVELRA